MLSDFLSVLGITSRKGDIGIGHKRQADSEKISYSVPHSPSALEIVPKRFIEIELDVAGWYAPGHHHPKDFISAIARQEKHYRLSENQVEQVWVKMDQQGGEYSDKPVDGAEPITLLMLWN